MSIEDKLKDYILLNYKSIRAFVNSAGLPYSTVDGILKRGIANSSIGNVLKICKALQISADELANNRIVPMRDGNKVTHRFIVKEIPELISFIRRNLSDFEEMTIDGKSLSDLEWETVLNSVTLSVEFVRNIREKEDVK